MEEGWRVTGERNEDGWRKGKGGQKRGVKRSLMGRIEDRDELMIGGKEKERRVTVKVGRRGREGLL